LHIQISSVGHLDEAEIPLILQHKMLHEMKLEEIQEFLIKIAHEAGDMILSAHPSAGGTGSKLNCKLDTLSQILEEPA